MSDYESEYTAPPRSIFDQKRIGTMIATEVVLDGQIIEFKVDQAIYRQGKMLESAYEYHEPTD